MVSLVSGPIAFAWHGHLARELHGQDGRAAGTRGRHGLEAYRLRHTSNPQKAGCGLTISQESELRASAICR